MSNHTPGPWEFRKDGFIYSLSTGERVCSPHSTLCNSHSVSEHTQDLKRNARLIAAAPELLEALEGVIRVADRATIEFDAARAAIAKAKGEQIK